MRQWAIVIGVNDYQFFEPLNCARRDAQALHQFLVEEVRFPAEQCLLLTDTSPPLWGKPTTPTRSNLLAWLELLTQNCFKPGDSLWFFFSGYGVCAKGRDYLAPLDGDPFAVETTCILMSSILSRLQATLSPGMLLILFDINRSQGKFSPENVGSQTAQLAKQFAIPTILSCEPEQFSREISSLGHGLFTIGLLEGLGYYQGATPATLMQFLGDRLPELSQYYYLPSQQPVSICPSEKLHQTLLPIHYNPQAFEENGTNGNGTQAAALLKHHDSSVNQSVDQTVNPRSTATAIPINPATVPPSSTPHHPVLSQKNHQGGTYQGSVARDLLTQKPEVVKENISPVLNQSEPISHVVAGLASTMTPQTELSKLTERDIARPNSEIPSSTISSTGNTSMNSGTPSNSSLPEEIAPHNSVNENLPRQVFWLCGILSLGLIAGVLWRNWSSILATPQSAIANSPAIVAPVPAPGQDIEQIRPTSANMDSQKGVVSPNVAAAPNATRTFNPVWPARPLPDQATGQELLVNAQKMTMSDQATPYRDAVLEAQRIPPNDPAYPAAQRDIAVWSGIILKIAQQRANQKQWDIAIMAADLVPPNNQPLHAQAQVALTEWCPMIKNQPVQFFPMQQAKNICSQQPI